MNEDLARHVVHDWLHGMKLTAIAAKYELSRKELYDLLKDHPAGRARWN